MLERYAVKVARTVLRGGSDSHVTPLPDQPRSGTLRDLQAFFSLRVYTRLKSSLRPPTCGYANRWALITSYTAFIK